MEVESEPVDIESVDVVESFDDAASGREGRVDLGFGVMDFGDEV